MADDRQDNQFPELDRALEDIDTSKRDMLRKLVIGAAFVIPVVMTFSVDGLLVSNAKAGPGNQITLS